MTSIAENQTSSLVELQRDKLVHYLGNALDIRYQDYIQAINHYISDPTALIELSERNFNLVDGLGAQKVHTAMNRLIKNQEGVNYATR